MNNHTLKVLEFDKLIGLLIARCQTELGFQKAQAVIPRSNIDLIKIQLAQTREIKSVMDTDARVPFRAIYNIKPLLDLSKVGSVLNEQDLLRVMTTVTSLNVLSDYFSNNRDRCPSVSKMAMSFEDFSDLSKSIERSISWEGLVLDSASANLAKIRNEIRILDNRIKEKINSIISSSKYRTYLQESIVTTRSDRYCVPVKSEYKSFVPGIVHDSSGSGSTLYIEPGVIVDSGNKLKEAYGKEREEIYKILLGLTEKVGDQADAIAYALDVSAEIDLITAKATLSYDLKCTEPKLNDRGKIFAADARHPLLPLETVVPIDIKLGMKFDCLLITGPNTGGKTVALKTVGLISIMAMCGMYVPCQDGSEVSVFSDIFADIGDEQSIEQSLSTFSGHMRNIVEITESAGSRSLVLLDELGAGTDPAEGAALAQSIILDLMKKNAKIIATTHYGELKQFAFITDRVENASVEFDTKTLKPTYRLLIGVPGSSNALHIASRMGISDDIISTARLLTEQEENISEEIIQRIEETHKEAAIDRIEAAKRLKELDELKIIHERELAVLKRQQANIEDKVRKRANKIITQYTEEINSTLASLKETTTESSQRQELRKKASSLVEDFQFKLTGPMSEVPKKEYKKVDKSLKVGDTVFVTTIEMRGVVESISSNNAVVSVNSMNMTVSLDKLAKSEEPEEKTIQKTASYTEIAMEKAKHFKTEINLLGLRADEAIYQLDKFMDNALASNAEKVRVVHGKGTGALRDAVRLYLKQNSFVASFTLAGPDEGGDGVTNVFFK